MGERPSLDTNMSTIILGLGNALRGDDGVGLAVAEALMEASALPDDISVGSIDSSGLDILIHMQGFHRVLMIDAADFGGAPGDWRCIPIRDLSFLEDTRLQPGNVHQSDLKEVIALGYELGILPKEIYLYAIQPHSLHIGIGLSEATIGALSEIFQDLFQRLGITWHKLPFQIDKLVEAENT